MREHSECEGFMVVKSMNSIGDESGISPQRVVPDYFENEDPNDTLRNPGATNTLSPLQLQQ